MTRPARRAVFRATIAAVAILLAVTGVVVSAPSNKDELLKDEAHRLEQAKATFFGGRKAGSSSGFEVVGHTDLGGRGFNADVWYHEGFAYVGQWGFSDWAQGSKERFCPSGEDSGVSVVDVSDPANPEVVSVLQNPAGTSAEDVVVYTAEAGPYEGSDIAAVGIQVCGGSRYDTDLARGLMLFDVTDAANPVELGFWDAECCTRGVHELEVEHHANGNIYAYASVPASGYPDSETESGVRDDDGDGDFRLIDITDPENPFQASSWGIADEFGEDLPAGLGCDPDPNYGHSAEPSEDGTLAFIAYWDSWFIALDVSDPENPVYLGRTVYGADEDGDAHSSMYDDARQLLFTADEDFCKMSAGIEAGYGYLRIYDYSDLSDPVQIGEYRTPNSGALGAQGSGDYTIHNPMLMGTEVYISWYSDGVRVVDVSDPTNPVEVAYFVPPAGRNPVKPPQRGTLSNTTQVWGVYPDEETGLVFASDMNTGLWILRRTDMD